MKSLALKLLSFLVPAAAACGFLLWWFSPTQTVIRTTKALFETFEVRALRLDGNDEINDHFATFLTPSLDIHGPDPLPNETLSRAEVVDIHRRFQSFMVSSRFTLSNPSVRFVTPTKAILVAEAQADLHTAGGQRRVMRYQIALTYEKPVKSWVLAKVQAHLR